MIQTQKLLHAEYVNDLFSKLRKMKIGNAQTEELSKRMCRTLPKRRKTLVRTMMKWKHEDSIKDLRQQKKEQTEVWRKCEPVIKNANIDRRYHTIWSTEKRRIRTWYKRKLERKLSHLKEKYGEKKEIPDDVNGVIIKDQPLEVEFESDPRCYDGVEINDNEKKVLQLGPKFTIYEDVDVEKTIAEIEKGMVKLRYEQMRKEKNKSSEPRNQAITTEPTYNHEKKEFNFRRMKATDMPTNKKIYLPQVSQTVDEMRIQVLKSEMVKTTEQYCKENKDKWKNMTKEEKVGLKSILKRKNDGDIVTNVTDKSGRFSIDTVENYIALNETHVGKDKIIKQEDYDEMIKEMNGHSVCWCKFLNMGKETGQEKRIRGNFHDEKPPLPGHRTLRKDHKTGYDPVKGPPGRPLCSADNSYNRSMSHLISSILREIIDDETTVCENTEDMLASFQKINEDGGVPMNTIILSTDVKALYPSLDIDFTADIVSDMFAESSVTIEGIDYEELGLYLSINYTENQLIDKGIQDYCTTRKHTRGQKPKITANGAEISREKRFEPWNLPKKKVGPEDGEIKKKLITEALRIAIKFIMKNHAYTFDNKIYKQENGGAIGVELTGDLAKVFMVWWARQLQQKKEEEDITTYLYKCYVDDINMLVSIPNEIYTQEIIIDERAKKSVQEIKRIGDSIHESIILETDCPENHEDRKMPILDLKVWLEVRNERKFIMHEYYMKQVSSKAVIDARSTLPWKQKGQS